MFLYSETINILIFIVSLFLSHYFVKIKGGYFEQKIKKKNY